MRIVIAPDKFKGCLSADQVASAIEAGLRTVDAKIEIERCPMADGGEGFVAALVAATNGTFITKRVTGPLPEMRVDARFGLLGDRTTAVIEMSAACGLALLAPESRNPLYTTTFGVGELLNAALDAGARRILLGIGGSATNDAGVGCAQATGHTIVLEDNDAVSITEPLVGADVARVVLVKRHRGERTDGIPITVACDVANPLFGPVGASRIFAPQKGATPEQVGQLDAALEQLARRNAKLDLAALPGAGAAGGLGFGMVAFFGAELKRGVDIVIDAVKLRERLAGADLCITGEGRLDSQTAQGKTVAGVAAVCGELGIPCIALAGDASLDAADAPQGLSAWVSITDRPILLAEAMRDATPLLTQAAANLMRVIRVGKIIGR